MDSTLRKNIRRLGADIKIDQLSPPRVFDLAVDAPDGSPPILTFCKAVNVDPEIQI